MNIERDITSPICAVLDSPEAIVVAGLRRTGKTTLLRSLMDEIPTDNKLFLDLENPANRKLFEDPNYDRLADNLRFLLEIGRAKADNYFVRTTNVDGHFQKAGFAPDLIRECHGSFHRLQCFYHCHDKVWY